MLLHACTAFTLVARGDGGQMIEARPYSLVLVAAEPL